MDVTLERRENGLCERRWVTHTYRKNVSIPFIPQIGMSLIVDNHHHRVKDVVWHQSNDAIVVELEPSMISIDDGWREV